MTEKDIKKAAENIRMPGELKSRILRECRSIQPSDEFGEEHVFTVEPAKPRIFSRIMTAAACLALIGGIGVSGVLISRSGAELSEELEQSEESVEETSEEVSTEPENEYDEGNVAPFGDVSCLELTLAGDEEPLPPETRQSIADFFNAQTWEEVDYQALGKIPGDSYFALNAFESENSTLFHIELWDSGYMLYCEEKLVDEDDCADKETEFPYHLYAIDYDSFIKNLCNIIYGEGIIGEEAPFADTTGCLVFSGFRNLPGFEGGSNVTLDEETSQSIRKALSTMYWKEVSRDEVTQFRQAHYGNAEAFSLCDEAQENYLNINLTGGYAIFSQAPEWLDEEKTMFRENVHHYIINDTRMIAMLESCLFRNNEGNEYFMNPPFGINADLECECADYTGTIPSEKYKELDYLLLGWNWGNSESYSVDVYDSTSADIELPEYDEAGAQKYAQLTGGRGIFLMKLAFYTNGTVKAVLPNYKESAERISNVVTYYDVDGEDDSLQPMGDLCMLLRKYLIEDIGGGSVVQKS